MILDYLGGPKSNDTCPYKRETQRGEDNVKMEAETVGMGPQSQECQGSHQKLGQARHGFPPRAQTEEGRGHTCSVDV